MANASSGSWRLQKAERFMNAAARALEAGDYETAVSRAYYAAFHALAAAFESLTGVGRRRWSHNFLPYFLRFPELDGLRPAIGHLYESRTWADYENAAFTCSNVERVMATARQVVDRSTEVSVMHKSKKLLSQAIDCFSRELKEEFPDLAVEPLLNPEDGYDAWIYAYVPPTYVTKEEDTRDFARRAEDRYWRERGVGLMTMIRKQKEPVHG